MTIKNDLYELNAQLSTLERGQSLIFDDLSNELYHAASGYSKSSLDAVNVSPAHYVWMRNAPRDNSKSPSLDFGTIFHCAVLEPERFDKEYVQAIKVNKSTKAGKEAYQAFKEHCTDNMLTAVDHDDYNKIIMMRDSLKAHPNHRVFKTGKPETSIFYKDIATGLLLKIRPDWITISSGRGQHYIVDLKTCSKPDFSRSIEDYRYYVQDSFYRYVYEKATGNTPNFLFCFVSSSISCGRYPVNIGMLSDVDREAGELQMGRDMNTILHCEQKNQWNDFELFERPSWARRRDGFE